VQLPGRAVLGVERTRATFLSYSEKDPAGLFTTELSALLHPAAPIYLVQETLLVMAPRLPDS
jgi:hypothetical protein